MKKIVIGTLSLLLSGSIAAQAKQVHFSADAIINAPNMAQQTGRLSVGEAGSRFDYQQNGRQLSKIELPSQGLARILFHTEKNYIEFKLPASNSAIGHAAQPCQPAPNLECKKLGDEEFNAIKVERWSVLPKGAPKPIMMLWDKTRKMTISQVFPNGVKVINKLIEKTKRDDLNLERWETTFTAPDGKTNKGMMVYAPLLQVAVKETQPNGLVKELKNIKIAEPDASLFKIPAGFQKIEKPATTGSVK